MGVNCISRSELPQTTSNDEYIVNLDNKTGTHWIFMKVQHPYIFWIDPMGTELSGYPTQEIREWATQNDFNKVYASDIQIQPLKSNLCGHICLYIAKTIPDKLTEKSFDKYLSNNFFDYGNIKNVSKIVNWSKQNNLM